MADIELKLARFIQDNFVQLTVYNEYDEEISSFGAIPEYELSGYIGSWKVYANVYTYDLDELAQVLGHEYFNDGIQIIWKDGYVVIDLMDIINYFDLDIKKVI